MGHHYNLIVFTSNILNHFSALKANSVVLLGLLDLAGVLAVGFFTLEQNAKIIELEDGIRALEEDVALLKTSVSSLCSVVS